jgi:2'-5' RNA ligase
MPARLRAFVAVEIPKGLLETLGAVQLELQRQGVRARWVKPGSIHLTLKFLGNIPAGQVADVADAVRAAACRHAPMRLSAGGMGVFPGLRRPRVIWIGISGQTTSLSELQRGLEEELSAIGFPREERAFRGHLTIGRFSEPADGRLMAHVVTSYADRTFGGFEARELVLFQSDLQPQGAVYTALAKAPLEGSL